jgi:hypothetical protein
MNYRNELSALMEIFKLFMKMYKGEELTESDQAFIRDLGSDCSTMSSVLKPVQS